MAIVRAPRTANLAISQASRMTCWLACFKMLYCWKGKDISLVEKLLKNVEGLKLDEAKSRGLLPREYAVAGRALDLSAYTYQLVTHDLEIELTHHGPLWCSGYWNGFSHVVLIVGVDKAKDMIYWIDPLRVYNGEYETSGRMDAFNVGRAVYAGVEWSVQEW